MKWIVTTTCSFDQNVTAVEFSAEQEEKAEKYLQWAYERFLKIEFLKIERKESYIPLNENACYIENRYARIVWLDDTYAELNLSCTIDPEEEFEECYKKSAEQIQINPEENTEKDTRYMLIGTDGYSIDSIIYASRENAREALIKAYEKLTPNEWNEDFKDMSYLDDDFAILYANGENVYVWNIQAIPEK